MKIDGERTMPCPCPWLTANGFNSSAFGLTNIKRDLITKGNNPNIQRKQLRSTISQDS